MPSIGKPDIVKQNNKFNKVSIHKSKITKGKVDQVNARKTTKDIGKNEFLKLLSYQLQHQDPLKPMDQHKFAADLAQFSQLEQLVNIKKELSDKNVMKNMEAKFNASNLLGKEVMALGSTVELQRDGQEAPVFFKLESPMQKVVVKVFDQFNNLIGQVESEDLPVGDHELVWDGNYLDGGQAKSGVYNITVVGWDEESNKKTIESKISGIVQGITFHKDGPLLHVGGRKIFLRDIASFKVPQK